MNPKLLLYVFALWFTGLLVICAGLSRAIYEVAGWINDRVYALYALLPDTDWYLRKGERSI